MLRAQRDINATSLSIRSAGDFFLSSWFCRRYPTASERLTNARRTYKRWTGQAARR
jgi:hypothetical protein